MFEDMTREVILARMLQRVPAGLDKREGSVIYDALAPAASELAQLYIELSTLLDRAFADTATGDDLTKKAQERSVFRRAATFALRLGILSGVSVPVGSRFSGGGINYAVVEHLGADQYRMQAETAGEAGNLYFGTLYPIGVIEGLTHAELADILIHGEDEESDEALRERYYDSLDQQAFGGNIADYKQHTNAIQGVGGTKVVPVWNGGGTVKIIIVDSAWSVPSEDLIDAVQTALDPTQNQGEGEGLAPIGHVVTVVGAAGETVDISFRLTYSEGHSWADVMPGALEVLQGYFVELISEWADSDTLTVRISQIETRMLGVDGVLDIEGTAVNGQEANLELPGEAVPVLGEVSDANP